MTISSIIHKEISEQINILWTHCDNTIFKNFLQKTIGCNLIEFDDTYFGSYDIDIILCNNRITYLDKCIESAKFFHCPLIIIDHDFKPQISIDIKPFEISPVLQISISDEINNSWNNISDIVLPLKVNDTILKEKWLDTFKQLKKESFILL